MYRKPSLQNMLTESIIKNLKKREQELKMLIPTGNSSTLSEDSLKRLNKTVVLMPFYGAGIGAGGSVVSTRLMYLKLT
jgi:hypothetical protein